MKRSKDPRRSSALMPESTLTHQIGFTRTNCAWIALNLFLNILMCYLVLQLSPRPNETSMNPYYGPNHIGDLPKDYCELAPSSPQTPPFLPFELTVPPCRCTCVDSPLTQHIPTYIPHVCVYHTHVHTHIGGGFPGSQRKRR